MRTNCLLLTLIVIPLMGQVSPVALSESKDVVPALDSTGSVTLSAASLKVDVAYPQGKKGQRCELTVVYDPKSGHFLWHNAEPNANMPNDNGLRINLIKAQRVVLFADPAGLIEFAFGDSLAVRMWRGRAASLDAAVSASTEEIRQGLAAFEGVGFHRGYKLVPIFGPLIGFDAKIPPGIKPFPSGFVCDPNRSAFCPRDNNTIASVNKQGNNWRLVLRNRFDVEVILDQNFDLVSIQQLTQPKQ